jgi:hypothetical protein
MNSRGFFRHVAICHGPRPRTYPSFVETDDFDRIVGRLRCLVARELVRVEAFVDRLELESSVGIDCFRSISGILSAKDALPMEQAIEDCERVDDGRWMRRASTPSF